MISWVEGKGLTKDQLMARIEALRDKADKTATEVAQLRLMETCMELRS